jgi:hypothetical protein
MNQNQNNATEFLFHAIKNGSCSVDRALQLISGEKEVKNKPIRRQRTRQADRYAEEARKIFQAEPGISNVRLGMKLGVSEGIASEIRKNLGIPPCPMRRITEAEREKIFELYNKDVDVKEISQKLDRPATSVLSVLFPKNER